MLLHRDAAVDSLNVSFGVRDIRFDAQEGFFLNRQHVKLRGFCDFGPFGAVGAATPGTLSLSLARAPSLSLSLPPSLSLSLPLCL